MENGAAFALMSQPGSLTLAPRPAAVDKVENRRAVLFVKFLDFCQSCVDNLLIPRCILLFVARRIANEGVIQILAIGALKTLTTFTAVDIAQVVDFQLFEQLHGLLLVLEDGGHDDHGCILFGDKPLLELELESAYGLVQAVEQLVEEVYDHLAHRHSYEQRHQRRQPSSNAHGP